MLDETRRPIRAGLAYLRSVKDDSAAQAALQRVQGPVRLYGQAFRKATMTANAARSAVVSALCEPMQVHHRFVVAMGDALCGTRFERLHALAKQYPDLRHIADQVEQAARECQQIRREQQCELEDRLRHHQMDWSDILSTITPAIDDLEIWSSIAPLGEQDRGVVREAIREQRTPKTRMKREVAEPLIAEHLTRRPHDTVAQVADKV